MIHNVSFERFFYIVLTVTFESSLIMVFRLGLLLVTSSRQSRFSPLTAPCLNSWWRWMDFRLIIMPQSLQQTSSALRFTGKGAIRLANREMRFWFRFLSLICWRIIFWRVCNFDRAKFFLQNFGFLVKFDFGIQFLYRLLTKTTRFKLFLQKFLKRIGWKLRISTNIYFSSKYFRSLWCNFFHVLVNESFSDLPISYFIEKF